MDATAVNPRPTFALQQASELTMQLYGVTATEISSLPSYLDQNFLVVDEEGSKFVLKIMNSKESENKALLEVQTLAMCHLCKHGVPVQTIIPTTMGQLMSMEVKDCGHGVQTYCVRLMTYIPGSTIMQSAVSRQDLYHVGKWVATVDKALQHLVIPNFDAMKRDDFLWSISSVPVLEQYLSVMDGDPLQDVVKAVIGQYKSHVQPKFSSFQKGIIHADLSDQNILVTRADDGHHEVSGILDFSLLMWGYNVVELSITIMYVMLENPSPLDVGGALLAGWESIIPLNDDERDSLFVLVLCRLCQSLVYGRHLVKQFPENEKYLLITAKNGNRLLAKLWEMGKQEVEKKWFSDASTFSVNHNSQEYLN